jgi:hypothetical protein
MNDHTCPAPGCSRQVPYEMLACHVHWYSLPKDLRARVWSTYRRSPHDDAHTQAIRDAIAFLNAKEPA